MQQREEGKEEEKCSLLLLLDRFDEQIKIKDHRERLKCGGGAGGGGGSASAAAGVISFPLSTCTFTSLLSALLLLLPFFESKDVVLQCLPASLSA